MSIVIILIGMALALVGYIQGILAGFKYDNLWGVLNIIFSPITPLVMAIQGNMGWRPLILMVVGVIISFVGSLFAGIETLLWMAAYP